VSLSVNTQGGTSAGWRNPFQGQPMPWQCQCLDFHAQIGKETANAFPRTNPGHLNRCTDCGTNRP
jgi:hypothetical protein